MIGLKFPHFPRKISANLLAPVEKPLLWLVILALISANLWAKTSLQPQFWSQALASLKNPGSFARHIDLAQAYWQLGLWPPAKRELLLAEELWQKEPDTRGNETVLGVTTSPVDLLELWQDEPLRLHEAYFFWQNMTQQTPDYRDAYVQLGAVAYQLGKITEAKVAWEKAGALDLTSSQIKEWLSELQRELRAQR
ncbi:MAG: hypothetical protein ACOY0S_03605 [Patescibacteria group bacterium]